MTSIGGGVGATRSVTRDPVPSVAPADEAPSRSGVTPRSHFRPAQGGLNRTAMVVAAIVGLLLRVWILRSPNGRADSDEAVTGLMARHFLHGHFNALYWGANYAGTLEVALTAGVFAVVGASTVALKSVPIALTFLAGLLLWQVGKEYADEQAGRLAAIVFWIFPGATVLLLMKAQVVYASGSCFVMLALLLAIRIRENPTALRLFLLGLVGGLCLWATPLLLASYLPIAASVLTRTWRRPLANLVALPGALLGAAPWLWFSVHTHWLTLKQTGQLPTTYTQRLEGCLRELYPLLLGLRQPISAHWLISPMIGRVLYVVIFGGMLILSIRKYGARILPIVATVVVFPFFYALSKTSWYWSEPRHGIFVSPLLLLLACSVVPRRLPVQALVGVLVLVLTINAVQFEMNYGRASAGAAATVAPGDLAPVMQAMQARGLRTCYAEYWLAYRIDFESHEKIICAAVDGDRYPPYKRMADQDHARVYLYAAHTQPPDDLAKRLTTLHLAYQDLTFGTVRAIVLAQPKRPEELNQCIILSYVPKPVCP